MESPMELQLHVSIIIACDYFRGRVAFPAACCWISGLALRFFFLAFFLFLIISGQCNA